MPEEQTPETPNQIDRRSLVKKGVKAAYIVPAVLLAVKATERPAYAATSGAPSPTPTPSPAPTPAPAPAPAP